MKAYLFSPFSPIGRLSLSAYWLLSTPLALLTVALRCYVDHGSELSNRLTIMVIGLAWMQFCLLSRRLQDCSLHGMFLLPAMGLSTFMLLVNLDPLILGSDPEVMNADWHIVFNVSYLAIIVLGIAWAYAMLAWGDQDENAFGPPFGETSDSIRQKRINKIRDRVRVEFAPHVELPIERRLNSTNRSSAGNSLDPTLEIGAAAEWDPKAANRNNLGFPAPAPNRKHGFGQS